MAILLLCGITTNAFHAGASAETREFQKAQDQYTIKVNAENNISAFNHFWKSTGFW